MKISNSSRLGVALKVLCKIKMKEEDVSIDTYSNCREQGFFLTSFKPARGYEYQRAVSFAENRNSDDIAVQYGVKKDFSPYGVFLKDEKYHKCKKFFRYDQAQEAADFITKWLTCELPDEIS